MDQPQSRRQRPGRPTDTTRKPRYRWLTKTNLASKLRSASALGEGSSKKCADVNVLVHDFE